MTTGTVTCPRCLRDEPSHDGFVVAHTQPEYAHGCGWCSHPSVDDDVCGICGQVFTYPDGIEETP